MRLSLEFITKHNYWARDPIDDSFVCNSYMGTLLFACMLRCIANTNKFYVDLCAHIRNICFVPYCCRQEPRPQTAHIYFCQIHHFTSGIRPLFPSKDTNRDTRTTRTRSPEPPGCWCWKGARQLGSWQRTWRRPAARPWWRGSSCSTSSPASPSSPPSPVGPRLRRVSGSLPILRLSGFP